MSNDAHTIDINLALTVSVPNDGYDYAVDIDGRIEEVAAAIIDHTTFVTSVATEGPSGSGFVGTQRDVHEVIETIRKQYPTATSFEVSSSDQGHYGYWLYAVKFDDDTVIDGNSGTFAKLANTVQDDWLADLSWGAFGDTNADSGFDVDMTTGRIIRNT
jgi:hypothetical protein